MEIKSLEKLRQPDDRTLHFTPLGLGGKMRAEDAAVFQKEVISRAELVPAAAEHAEHLRPAAHTVCLRRAELRHLHNRGGPGASGDGARPA